VRFFVNVVVEHVDGVLVPVLDDLFRHNKDFQTVMSLVNQSVDCADLLLLRVEQFLQRLGNERDRCIFPEPLELTFFDVDEAVGIGN